MRQITEIILHCSAGSANATAADIRRYHILPKDRGGRGWSDIGYHWVIRQDGTIEKGRDEARIGAHVIGHNASSIGICLVGGAGDPPQNNFNEAQFKSLAILLRDVAARFPEATIHGHNEYSAKACPVFSIRKFAAEYTPELSDRLGERTR